MLRMSTQGLLVGTTLNSMLVIKTADSYTPLQGATLHDTPLTQVEAK